MAVHGDVPWTAYTPTLSALSVGSGTLAGRYQIVGKTVDVYVEAVLGAGFSITPGISVQLPAAPAVATFAFRQLGTCFLYHPATNALNLGLVTRSSASGQVWQQNGQPITATSPWVWAAGDVISWTLRYEMV